LSPRVPRALGSRRGLFGPFDMLNVVDGLVEGKPPASYCHARL